jgi:hypothetical protein
MLNLAGGDNSLHAMQKCHELHRRVSNSDGGMGRISNKENRLYQNDESQKITACPSTMFLGKNVDGEAGE